jgi:hypothetical protein
MNTRLNNANEYQNIDSTDIYLRNAAGVFYATHEIATWRACGVTGSIGYGAAPGFTLAMLVSYLSLPFTMTVGAGIKTAMDVNERIPLSLNDIENMQGTLRQLDDEKNSKIVDELASAICNFEAQSKSCMQLQQDLINIDKEQDKSRKQFRRNKMNYILDCVKTKEQKILAESFQNNNIKFFKPVNNENVKYQFSESDQLEIEEYVSKQMPPIIDKSTSQKIQLISDYLAASHNAGKKMEHHILNIMKPIIEEIKPSLTINANRFGR